MNDDKGWYKGACTQPWWSAGRICRNTCRSTEHRYRYPATICLWLDARAIRLGILHTPMPDSLWLRLCVGPNSIYRLCESTVAVLWLLTLSTGRGFPIEQRPGATFKQSADLGRKLSLGGGALNLMTMSHFTRPLDKNRLGRATWKRASEESLRDIDVYQKHR